MAFMQTLSMFRDAVTRAQTRTGDRSISTDVDRTGKIRISSVTFNKKGKATIVPFTDYLPQDEALAYLNQMGKEEHQQ